MKTGNIRLKTFFVASTVLFLTLSINSCSKDEEIVKNEDDKNKVVDNQGNSSDEKAIFSLTFEKSNEGFVSAKSPGSRDISPDPTRPVKKVTEDENNCGELFIGKNQDFTQWKGKDFEGSQTYHFKGNKTTFLGLNMGACKGYFDGVAVKDFTLSKSLKKSVGKIEFKYYRPGDFTGWKPNYYNMSVSIYKKDETEKPYLEFSPSINPDGWVNFSKKLTEDLPKGSYFLVVKIAGGSAAIDDIKLFAK